MANAGETLAEVTGQALGTLLRPAPGSATEWLANVGPQLNRFKRQQAIEDAIMAFAPDADEAQEILDALTESLRRRYEDNAEDALSVAREFREALAEVNTPETVVVPKDEAEFRDADHRDRLRNVGAP